MNLVSRDEILPLGEYERIRDIFRARIIQEKKNRRFSPDADISLVFENHDTVLFQVQEMLRTERITKEAAVQHEIDTYNELVPGPHELSATLFIEIPERERRDARLVELAGVDHAFSLEIAGQSVKARNETRGLLPDRTTAVHYLKFPLGASNAAAWQTAAATQDASKVFFVVEHPALRLRVPVPVPVLVALAEDLGG
jgi:hypothetical protein